MATQPRTTLRPRPHGSSECQTELGPPAATCHCSALRVQRHWGRGGNSVSVFTEARPSVCRLGGHAAHCREPHLGHQSAGPPAWRSADFSGCGAFAGKGLSCPPVCTCLGHQAAGQPLRIPPALRGGPEAQRNKLAEISRASYLPKPACSHISQNRVPGRDVNSEMQGQLQRKIVERNRQESCLLSPRVSEGSPEQARAMRGHLLGTAP